MARHSRRKKLALIVYALLGALIAWQGFALIKYTRRTVDLSGLKTYQVNIEGNVRRPGIYRIPEGTTHFEILKMAGVRPNSNISSFNLSSQVNENSRMEVGTLDQPVNTTVEDKLVARLEFYFGEISHISADGRSNPQHEGMEIAPGDRIITELSTQAEISIGAFSRVDIDAFSEVVFDKIGLVEENKKTTELFQKSGLCWYKSVYTKGQNELFRVMTHSGVITVGGTGADYLIEVQNDRIQINLSDGLLLVERTGGGEALNMISGQSVTIYKDGRPFQVSKLTPDISANERFSQLSQKKVKYMTSLMPMNYLFCTVPTSFFLISIQYETGSIHVITIPPVLLIEQFAQNISTLDEAFLFGGPAFVSTFVERVFDTRISKYSVIDKDDVLRIADILGGVHAVIDAKTAASLNLSSGSNKLSGSALALYLAADTDLSTGQRRLEVLKSIINEFRNRKATLTMILAEQIIHGVETNFTASDAMDQYSKFMANKNWTFKDHAMPVRMTRRGNKVCYDPVLEECKTLLSAK
ncbi:MAG: hypothetical protein GX556_01480 [Fibrobacter sp.]|nr:hypothetical protein [Fibrobacter sp.]